MLHVSMILLKITAQIRHNAMWKFRTLFFSFSSSLCYSCFFSFVFLSFFKILIHQHRACPSSSCDSREWQSTKWIDLLGRFKFHAIMQSLHQFPFSLTQSTTELNCMCSFVLSSHMLDSYSHSIPFRFVSFLFAFPLEIESAEQKKNFPTKMTEKQQKHKCHAHF